MSAATAACPEIEWRSAPRSDPSERTLEALDHSMDTMEREFAIREDNARDRLQIRAEIRQREHASLQELIEQRLGGHEELSAERVASMRREIDLHEKHRVELKADSETHRLELKSDGEKTLTTATIAAEKAVQAALAAAEKARDQQTIASQLATTKAEEASKEQMKQQGETFTTAISGLSTGYNDVKTAISELRAEQRGVAAQVIAGRDTSSDMRPMIEAIAALTRAQSQNEGKQIQVVDNKAGQAAMIAIIGVLLLAVSVVMPLLTKAGS